MKKIFLTFVFCYLYYCCLGQSEADSIRLNKAHLISMVTERMYIFKNSRKDIYKTIATFQNIDSSLFTLIFRGQEPLPVKFSNNEENILPIIDGIRCFFQLNNYYDLEFHKICKEKAIGRTYYYYFVDFDRIDCSHIVPLPYNLKRAKKIKVVELMHPYVEIKNHLYEMDVFNCTTKFH